MTNTQNTKTAAPAWEMRVDIRTKKDVVATNLSLEEALNFITAVTPRGLAVVLPTGALLPAGPSFTMFYGTLMGAKRRMEARA